MRGEGAQASTLAHEGTRPQYIMWRYTHWESPIFNFCPILYGQAIRNDGFGATVYGPLSFCNVGALWPNGWMDQDATWYGGRPRFTRHC